MADTVMSLVEEKPVVIFSKSSCDICYTIKTLICGFGANPTVYEIDEISNGEQLERELMSMGCMPSVPAVFIGQRLVGGSNEVMTHQLRSELVRMLIEAQAIWV